MKLGIFAKMALMLIISIMIAIIPLIFTVRSELQEYIGDAMTERLHLSANAIEDRIEAGLDTVYTFLWQATRRVDIGEAVAKLDMSRIEPIIMDMEKNSGINFITLSDSSGTVIMRSHSPRRGDSVAGQGNVRRSLAGEPITVDIESGSEVTFSVRGGSPIKHEGKIVGVLTVGVRLDTLDFVDSVKAKYGTEVTLFKNNVRIATTLTDSAGKRMVGTTQDDTNILDHVIKNGKVYTSGNCPIGGKTYTVMYKPFANKSGKIMGMIFLGMSEEARADMLSSLMFNIILIGAVVALIIGIVAVFLIVRPIVKALNKGVVFATDISNGNLQSQLDVKRSDEIGRLADALRAIPGSLTNIIAEYDVLEKRVETGDLEAQGDAGKFSGDFAKLIQGTNGILTRFRTIIDNIPSPVVILNKDLVANYLNIVARQVAGDKYKGKTCFELMAREDFNGPNCSLKIAVESKNKSTSETVAHPQGKAMDISYTAIPMLDDKGQIVAVMQLITDLTAIKSTQRTIIEVAEQALEISNRVAGASERLAAQVDQVSAGTEVQRDRAASTATAMEEMNSTVLEVARNAGQAREQAEATQSKASEGTDLVREVVKAIEKVNVVAQQLETNMQELGSQAENIGSVMNVISDIADQTNLLALNAAIEAARAGEYGRGFAVVADEVRKLAEKTMGATSEVGASISGIQSSTATNIERVAEAARGVSLSTELASTSGEALAEILKLASDNAELITSIAAAAEEQSATSDEINRAVDEINRIAGETARGMSDSTHAVSELSTMAQELKTLLDKLQASN